MTLEAKPQNTWNPVWDLDNQENMVKLTKLTRLRETQIHSHGKLQKIRDSSEPGV